MIQSDYIQSLVGLIHQCGIREAVICPGSRSAPLVYHFHYSGLYELFTIDEERSAGYFALGLIQSVRRPVAVITTSGTAAVNLHPAMAEAYFSRLPLLAVTADRPSYLLDKNESQTIYQENLFGKHAVSSCDLETVHNIRDLHKSLSVASESLKVLLEKPAGPVHLNIRLEEPLYDLHIQSELPVSQFNPPEINKNCDSENISSLIKDIDKAESVLILAGQSEPDIELSKELEFFLLHTEKNVLLLAEHFSNLAIQSDRRITDIDGELTRNGLQTEWDLLIYLGGQTVSRKFRNYLRNNLPDSIIHIGREKPVPLDFFELTHNVESQPAEVFGLINRHLFSEIKEEKDCEAHSKFKVNEKEDSTKDSSYGEVYAVALIHKMLPSGSVLHLGNSLPARHILKCQPEIDIEYRSNRGTAGIDGCLSTAVGSALGDQSRLHVIILGDLSFLYDINALRISPFPRNLRIFVLNNGGGQIFSQIPGPAKTGLKDKYFVHPCRQRVKDIASAYSIPSKSIACEEDFETISIEETAHLLFDLKF